MNTIHTNNIDARRLRHAALLSAYACIALGSSLWAQAVESSSSGATGKPATTAEAYADGLRRWQPSDTPQVRRVLQRSSTGVLTFDDVKGVAAIPSPDGSHFVVVTRHGDMEQDRVVERILMFSASEVRKAIERGGDRLPAPVHSFTYRSTLFSEPLIPVGWDDREGFIFKANLSPGSARQAYRLDASSGEVTAITEVLEPEKLFAIWCGGKGSIFSTINSSTDLAKSGQYPVFPITEKLALGLFYFWSPPIANEGQFLPPQTITQYKHYVRYGEQPVWPLKSDDPIRLDSPDPYYGFVRLRAPYFSQDGRFAVMLRSPKEIPRAWKAYQRLSAAGLSDRLQNASEVPRVSQFMLIDLEHGIERPLFDAPSGASIDPITLKCAPALWTRDGRNVVLVNTALPLQGEGASADHEAATYIVACNIENRRWEKLEQLRDSSGVFVKDVRWLEEGKSFLVQHERTGKPAAGTQYTWDGEKWQTEAVAAEMPPAPHSAIGPQIAGGLTIDLRQSQNDPPMLYARLGKREIALLPDDPAMQGLWLAPTQDYEWKDSESVMRTGGLTLPRVLPPKGHKLPLVIQVKRYDPEFFRPSGPYTTAFATQELAAQGYAVLSLPDPESSSVLPAGLSYRQKIDRYIDWLETASESLAATHGIDLQRVGVVGFSRTGYLLHHAITRPRRMHIAAAVVADSAHGTFIDNLNYVATGESYVNENYQGAYGGPFFQAKKAWLDNELSFNVDKVSTPVLFADNVVSPLLTLPMIGVFKMARRPMEYCGIVGRYHELEHPRPTEASHALTVDWMNFWLLGKETPRTDDPTRYERWRKIKADWELQQAWEAEGNPVTSVPAPGFIPGKMLQADAQKIRDEIRAAGVADPGHDPQVLNAIAYRAMYMENDTAKALRYLRWNLALFEKTRFGADMHDSLAEGLLVAGDRDGAIKHYTKALELNPDIHTKAAAFLAKLKAGPANLAAVQVEARADYEATTK